MFQYNIVGALRHPLIAVSKDSVIMTYLARHHQGSRELYFQNNETNKHLRLKTKHDFRTLCRKKKKTQT